MKKGIIFIGPQESGKTRKAREIANRFLSPEAVWINAHKNQIENDPFVFSDCDENTKLVVIEELNLISLLCFLHVTSEGLVVNRMGKEQIIINPRIIIEFQSWVTKEMLPTGASFARRFDVFEFPTDKGINL